MAAAHRKGVIHRDVKPANVLISEDGQALLLDFGLAALAGADRLTQTKVVMGTTAYLAPEALVGGPVDARADLWALGVVLYEMLTGRLPFDSAYPQALIYSILNEAPVSVREIRDGVPDGLAGALERALAKSPEHRYQTADAMLQDLRRGFRARPAAAVSALIPRVKGLASVAVLPFAHRGRDPDGEFLSDGLTEEPSTR